MALTVASVFLIRWCSSSRISFCNLSAVFTFLGVDARLSKQNLGINACLLEQQAKAVVFRRQELL